MAYQVCENCGFRHELLDPSKLFWIGNNPPDNRYSYCPYCGEGLTTKRNDPLSLDKEKEVEEYLDFRGGG